jgi:hypothetical protein
MSVKSLHFLFCSDYVTLNCILLVQALEAPREPRRPKVHWDHVLAEMMWLSKVALLLYYNRLIAILLIGKPPLKFIVNL